jgi:hypothetical protein
LQSLNAQNLMQIKIDEIHFYNTFGFNVFLALKIMNFDNVALTKIIPFYVIKNMNA